MPRTSPARMSTASARRPGVLLALALAAAVPAAAQTPLSLQDAVERAVTRNHDVLVQRENVALADTATARALGAYDPLVRLDGRARVRTDPFNSVLSGAPPGALAPRTTALLGSASFSRLFASGASVSAASSLERDTSNSILALLTPSYLTSLAVDLRQPLLQGRKIDQTRRALRVAAVDQRRSAATLQRTLSETVAAVERAYWTLVAARRDVDVRQRTVTLAERQRDDTQARIESGTAPESDLAAPTAEIARRRGDLVLARDNARRAEHALKALLTDGPDDPLWNAPLEPTDPPDAPRTVPDLATALAAAVAHRPEVAEARTLADRQDIEIDTARERLRPTLDLVASYALRGLAGDQNPNAYPIGGRPVTAADEQLGALIDSYATLFTHRFADVSIGVSYTVPIGNRAAKADLAAAEIGRRQADTLVAQVTQRVGLEVRNALVGLESASERIDVARAQREAAVLQLQAEQDRFDAGLTLAFFVLTRQNDLAQAELAETAALADYRKALAEYLRASGTLLEQRSVLVDAPAPPKH